MKIKIFGVFFAAFMAFGSFAANANEWKDIPREKAYANVAQNKPVFGAVTYQENLADPDFPEKNRFAPEKLTDGNTNTATIIGMATGDYLQVDLLRRYKLEKIELSDRYDADHADMRGGLQLLGSNDESFSEYEILGELGAAPAADFPHQGCWEINLNGENAFRYLRISKTGGYAYGGFGELRAYASFNVFEVSRDKRATGNYWYETCNYDWAAPQTVLDGTEGNMSAWINYNTDGYNWLQVDLDGEYHIGYIEMTPRPEDSGATNFYQAFDFYGSNHALESEEEKNYVAKPGTTSGLSFLDEEHGYKTLSRVFTADRYIGGFDSEEFPLKPDKAFMQSVDEREAFRYITYKHTWPLGSLMGSLKLCAVAPEVCGTKRDGNYIYISFTDEMDFGSEFDSSLISVKNSLGKEIPFSLEEESQDTVKLYAELENGETYNVVISENVKNSYGTPMQSSSEFSFKMPPAIEVKDFLYTSKKDGTGDIINSLSGAAELGAKAVIKNNTVSKNETAVIFMLVFDENGYLVSTAKSAAEVSPGEEKSLSAGIDLPEDKNGISIKTFLWKDYKTMNSWTPLIKIN